VKTPVKRCGRSTGAFGAPNFSATASWADVVRRARAFFVWNGQINSQARRKGEKKDPRGLRGLAMRLLET
jgi:hypothetical protein